MEKIRVSCVAYLNSKPFLKGLQVLEASGSIELNIEPPKICAQKLINNEVDIGLVPVASIPLLPKSIIISKLGIGADGAVGSVMLFSECPLNEISEILLDHESMTSVNLCKVLCRDHWKIHPKFTEATSGFEKKIGGTIAGVVIGDRAIELRGRYHYELDLPAEWKQMTGLPFIFACWVSTKELDELFLRTFASALESGLAKLEDIIQDLEQHDTTIGKFAREYFTQKLNYNLSEKHFEGLKLFWNLIR
jgi:chorismate dehydratase